MTTEQTTPAEIEKAAQDMARYTPRHAIEGWVAGLRANAGPADELAVCERALEIRDEQRPVVVTGWDGASRPIRRYEDELHLPDHARSIVR